MDNPILYLASQSPRRAELLRQIGVGFLPVVVSVDESTRPGESASDYVRRLAEAKAGEGWHSPDRTAAELPVLGSDTCVVLDDQILGKPRDKTDGLRMLARLGGRSHQVMTAVCLYAGDFSKTVVSVSEVTFRQLTPEEIELYWETGEPADKAGGYAIQGRAAVFVKALHGSFSGVVGLPLMETDALLREYRAYCEERKPRK